VSSDWVVSRTLRYLLSSALVGAIAGLAVLALLDRSKPDTGYADAVARAAPSVVNIYSSKVVTTRRLPICELPRYRDLCRALEGANPRLQNSLGSGVIVREDGYILTNAHVIADADEILVAFSDGQTTSAKIIGTDPETDLAVIEANATGLTPIELGHSDAARVGDVVLAIGNPFGIGQTVSMGIISAKGRYGLSASPFDDYLQTDAAINPGNSGGALIDANGRLVGINSLIYSQTGGYQGIGFAVPAQLAMSVLDEIIREGRVIRGWLGIEVVNAVDSSGHRGLVVANVLPDSPAARAGLARGDVILSINGEPATTARVVTQQTSSAAPGSALDLQLLRDGEPLELHATAGVRPVPE
jgi:serine protease DegS